MKLSALMMEVGKTPTANAPKVMMWIAPSGAPIDCPDLEAAQAAAPYLAARHPGCTVGVYELVGYALAPLDPPDYTPSTPRDSATANAPQIEALTADKQEDAK